MSERGHIAMRTCVGCGVKAPLTALVRLSDRRQVDRPERERPGGNTDVELLVDLLRRAGGRGAYVHGRSSCVQQACSRGLARAFKRRVQVAAKDLALNMRSQCSERVLRLARRGSMRAIARNRARATVLCLVPVLKVAMSATLSAQVLPLAAGGRAIVASVKEPTWINDDRLGAEILRVHGFREGLSVLASESEAVCRSPEDR